MDIVTDHIKEEKFMDERPMSRNSQTNESTSTPGGSCTSTPKAQSVDEMVWGERCVDMFDMIKIVGEGMLDTVMG